MKDGEGSFYGRSGWYDGYRGLVSSVSGLMVRIKSAMAMLGLGICTLFSGDLKMVLLMACDHIQQISIVVLLKRISQLPFEVYLKRDYTTTLKVL